MKMKSLVVDDEPLAREGIAEYVHETPFLELTGLCKNALEASQMLQQQPVDLLLLDIHMPRISGIEFLKSLAHPPFIILTTAYREYAIEGFELNVLDYLVKPISFQRFLKAANKAFEQFEMKQSLQNENMALKDESFFIKSDGKYIRIYFDEVLFIEGLKDYVFIHTQTAKYLTLISLKNVENLLPENRFMRVHRSFIAALNYVEQMDGNQLKIKEHTIPVSKNLRDSVYQKLVGNKLWKR